MASLSRSVFESTSILSISGIAVRSLAILTTPVLTALLLPAAYGVSAYVQTLASIGSVLALMGIDMAYARFYFDAEGGQSQKVERFCWRMYWAMPLRLHVSFTLHGIWWWRSILVYRRTWVGFLSFRSCFRWQSQWPRPVFASRVVIAGWRSRFSRRGSVAP